jgi:cyclic dehypoxanthinyl futalosine synthase
MGISQQQALDCFASDDLIGLGMEADSVRRSLHPEGIVTYAVGDALAVKRSVATSQPDSTYITDFEAELVSHKKHSPFSRLQSLNAADIDAMELILGVSLSEVLIRLRGAGLDAIAGSHEGVSPERWLEVHASAHRAGLRSCASLEFGGSIDTETLVNRLLALRNLQQETGGFTALSLFSVQPKGDRGEFEKPTAVEYLRTLAVARMVLDNIENVESSGIDEGLKVMQMALRFGANDGGTLTPSAKASFTEADLRRVIRDAGFTPVERDTLYQTMFLNN